MTRRRMMAVLLLIAGLWVGGAQAWQEVKGELALRLIEQAWESQDTPWPWADFQVDGRLFFPKAGAPLYALAGGDNVMAFGPKVQRIGELTMLSAHRDRSFARLAELGNGDHLWWQGRGEDAREYRVIRQGIVDTDAENLNIDPQAEALLLVTCYPFDAIGGQASQRYWVLAVPVA